MQAAEYKKPQEMVTDLPGVEIVSARPFPVAAFKRRVEFVQRYFAVDQSEFSALFQYHDWDELNWHIHEATYLNRQNRKRVKWVRRMMRSQGRLNRMLIYAARKSYECLVVQVNYTKGYFAKLSGVSTSRLVVFLAMIEPVLVDIESALVAASKASHPAQKGSSLRMRYYRDQAGVNSHLIEAFRSMEMMQRRFVHFLMEEGTCVDSVRISELLDELARCLKQVSAMNRIRWIRNEQMARFLRDQEGVNACMIEALNHVSDVLKRLNDSVKETASVKTPIEVNS